MKAKAVIFLPVVFFAAMLTSAENLIVNPRLVPDKNGKVPGWIVVRGTASAKDGFTEIAPSSPGKGFVIFQRLKAKPETDYLLEYDYRSPGLADCKIYCEEKRKDGSGRVRYRSFSSGRASAPAVRSRKSRASM